MLASVPVRARAAFGVALGEAWTAQSSSARSRRCGAEPLGERERELQHGMKNHKQG